MEPHNSPFCIKAFPLAQSLNGLKDVGKRDCIDNLCLLHCLSDVTSDRIQLPLYTHAGYWSNYFFTGLLKSYSVN